MPAPLNVYGTNKWKAELKLKEFCREFAVPYAILRMSWIYGPGMKKNPIYDIYNGELYMDLMSELDFIYIGDVCDAFILASKNDDWNNMEVNISSGKSISLRQIYDMFQGIGFDRTIDIKSNIFKKIAIDNKLASQLGWTPKITIKEGLKKTYESFSR